MAIKIVVTNRKGGVGKTTVATHLAAGLALKGYRVGLVDTDSQGHAALAFGMEKENGLHTIMCDPSARFADVVRQVPPKRFTPVDWPMTSELYLIPGDKRTSVIPVEQPDPFRFREVLEDFADLLNLHFIIVDTGPSASMFDGSVNFAADRFLYVTECALLSFDGLIESRAELEKLSERNRRYGSDTSILGVIPNKARMRTDNHKDNIAALSEQFDGLVWPPIHLGTTWEQAMQYGQMMFSYLPRSAECQFAWSIVDQTLLSLGVTDAQSE